MILRLHIAPMRMDSGTQMLIYTCREPFHCGIATEQSFLCSLIDTKKREDAENIVACLDGIPI